MLQACAASHETGAKSLETHGASLQTLGAILETDSASLETRCAILKADCASPEARRLRMPRGGSRKCPGVARMGSGGLHGHRDGLLTAPDVLPLPGGGIGARPQRQRRRGGFFPMQRQSSPWHGGGFRSQPEPTPTHGESLPLQSEPMPRRREPFTTQRETLICADECAKCAPPNGRGLLPRLPRRHDVTF